MQRKPKNFETAASEKSSEANISAARRDDPPVSTPSAAEKPPSEQAVKAAELEIGANHLRALRECHAPLGKFVQDAIDKALEDYRNATSRG